MDKAPSHDDLLKRGLAALDLDALAEEAGWSAKSRKATALGWCLALCQACSTKAPSLQLAAHFMGLVCALTISRQAMHKRLLKGGAELVAKALEAALAVKARLPGGPALGAFARVLVQDSTTIALPQSMRAHYPGSSNQSGGTAAMKIQAIYDMAGNRFLSLALGAFTRNDQAAAMDILERVAKGDLVLRDLGYFTTASLAAIAAKGAHFLSRYKSGTALLDAGDGKPIGLLGRLRGKARADFEVLVGAKARLPARLIAVRLKEEVANRRRQKARGNRDRRCRPSAEALELLGWQIMVTSCGAERLPLDQVLELYSMRWRIETVFKSWKSGLGIDRIHPRVSKSTLDAYALAGLLRVTLIHAVVIPWLERRDPARKISVCKLMDLIAASAGIVGIDPKANEILLENLSRHCRYEKRRKRANTLERWDRLVTEMEGLS